MPRDSTPPPAALSALPADALTQMREAMIAYLEQPGDSAASLRSALRAISAEAQARQLRAEHLIIALKQVWHSVPDVQRAATREEQDRLLDRLITVCIEEYYSR